MKKRKLLLASLLLISACWMQAQTFEVVRIQGRILRGGKELKPRDAIYIQSNHLPSNVVFLDEDAAAVVLSAGYGKRIIKRNGIEVMGQRGMIANVRSAKEAGSDMIPSGVYFSAAPPEEGSSTVEAEEAKTLYVFGGLTPVYYVGEAKYQLQPSRKDSLVLVYHRYSRTDGKPYSVRLRPELAGKDTVRILNIHPDSLFRESGKSVPLADVHTLKIEYRLPSSAGKDTVSRLLNIHFLDRDEVFIAKVREALALSAGGKEEIIGKIDSILWGLYGLHYQRSDDILLWLQQKFNYPDLRK